MTDHRHIDCALSPWLYDGSTTPGPTETRLLSTEAAGDGGVSVRLTPEAMTAAATRLDSLRGEASADINAAIKDSDHVAIGRNLDLTKAVQYVHDRWGDKLTHLLEDMDDRASSIRKAAANWQETEAANAKALGGK